MKCPNCQLPFVEEKDEKFFCSTCGWLEKVGKEWKKAQAPESPPPQESPAEPETKTMPRICEVQNVPQLEPDPAALEPDPAKSDPNPAALEPDPAAHEPDPSCSVKSYLGGLVTVTEVDE